MSTRASSFAAGASGERTWCLSPSHVSAIAAPSSVRVTVVPTSNRDLPLAPAADTANAPEHASFATYVTTQDAGDVLVRVVHHGLAIELSSLSNPALSPHRFVFPSPILANPTVLVHQLSELHVILATEHGSLFTLVFSTLDPDFFHHTSSRSWFHEHRCSVPLHGPVHAHDPHSVWIGLANGGLLNLTLRDIGYGGLDDYRWDENTFHKPRPSGFFTWRTPEATPSQILSFASHPPPTASTCVFAVSQDRMLAAYIGPQQEATIALPRVPGMELQLRSPSPDKQNPLLDDGPRTLVRVVQMGDASDEVSSSDDPDNHLQVLVFIATPAGESGGFFQLYHFHKSRCHFTPIRQIYCPGRTSLYELRDFIVREGTLYTLWDDQRASILEWVALDIENAQGEETWYRADLSTDHETPPEVLEDRLDAIGESLSDVFLDILLQPGSFSPYSLQAAVKQYTDALLSLPGPPAPQLTNLYPTLAENIAAVVGCTVKLEIDPSTGRPQQENFNHALRRDWEGFLARCREFERRARRPLNLAVADNGGVFIFERERIVVRTWEDDALQQYRALVDGAFDPTLLVDIAWKMRGLIKVSLLYDIEAQAESMLAQDMSEAYVDAFKVAYETLRLEDEIVNGPYCDEINDLLAGVPDLRGLLRDALETIAALEFGVKAEDEEAESLLMASPPRLSNWQVAAITSYTRASILARYEMCLALVAFVIIRVGQHSGNSESHIVELFAAFRAISMYRLAAREPASETDAPPSGRADGVDDDVLERLNNLRMMSPAPHISARPFAQTHRPQTHSLLHRLILQSQQPVRFELPHAAHQFMTQHGLLLGAHRGKRSCSNVTPKEAAFVDVLRRSAFLRASSDLARWLPRTPAVVYLRGRLELDYGRGDTAADLLEGIGGVFASHGLWAVEDMQSLRIVLPVTVDLASEHTYFVHLATLFEEAGWQEHVIKFTKLAIRTMPADLDNSELWYKIFRGYVSISEFEDAYMSLVATPNLALKRESVSHLVQAMCEADAVDRLLSLNFVSFSEDVEAALSFKARNADPLARPIYSNVLYSWFSQRGDFRSAARTMYLQARKLGDKISDADNYELLSTMQIQALLVAINSLSVVESRNAWFTIPLAADTGRENRQRRRLAHHIPEDQFAPGSKAMELVQLEDLRWEYNLVLGRLDLWRRDPTVLGTSLQFSAADVVAAYGRENLFDSALRTGTALGQDLSHVFVRMAQQCVRLGSRDLPLYADGSFDWLLSEEVEPGSGTPAQRGWRYVQLALEQHDIPESNYPYRKAVIEGLLDMDRCDCVPAWLSRFFEDNQPDYLIRTWLKYGYLYQALESSLKMVRKVNSTLLIDVPQHAAVSWLPYPLLDEVIASCETVPDVEVSTKRWRDELRAELNTRIRRMQKWTRDASQ